MDKEKLFKWARRVFVVTLMILGFLYFFVEFYVPQKIEEYEEIIGSTRRDLSSSGAVSATILPGSKQYNPQIQKAYLREKDYRKTFRLLKTEIDSGDATVGDYILIVQLLKSDKELRMSSTKRKRRLVKYRSQLKKKYGHKPEAIMVAATPTDTSIKKLIQIKKTATDSKQEYIQNKIDSLRSKKEYLEANKKLKRMKKDQSSVDGKQANSEKITIGDWTVDSF